MSRGPSQGRSCQHHSPQHCRHPKAAEAAITRVCLHRPFPSSRPPPSREEVTSPLHATTPLHDPLDLLSIRGLLHRSLPGSRSPSSRGEVMSPCMFVSLNQLYLRQFQAYYLFLAGSTTMSPALLALRVVFTQPDWIG